MWIIPLHDDPCAGFSNTAEQLSVVREFKARNMLRISRSISGSALAVRFFAPQDFSIRSATAMAAALRALDARACRGVPGLSLRFVFIHFLSLENKKYRLRCHCGL